LLLDQPIYKQYGNYLWRVLHGDFGNSWSFQMPVSELIFTRLPATAEVATAGMFIALIIAVPFGLLAAKYPNSWVDRTTTILAVAGAAIPHFWLGPLLILAFSIGTGWFPVSGRGTFAHLVLPAVTLGIALAALLMRMLRSGLIEELTAGYIRTARAKGSSQNRVLLKHALRNALLPVVTLMALQFGSLLTGAVITETIFSWPGLGRLLIQAIFSRDYPLVQGCVLVFAILYVMVNLVADLLYGLLDPRITA
jgi:peptide/nickel transport system permease protein